MPSRSTSNRRWTSGRSVASKGRTRRRVVSSTGICVMIQLPLRRYCVRRQLRAPLPGSLDLTLAQWAIFVLDDEALPLADRAVACFFQPVEDFSGCAARRPPDPRLERCGASLSRRQPASHVRIEGCDKFGGCCAWVGSLPMFSRILSDGRLKANRGAPATIKSVPSSAAPVASAVVSAGVSGPIPSAIARATAAVLPHKDS